MNKAIFKYPLTTRVTTIDIPKGNTILTVQVVAGVPSVYAIIDKDAELEKKQLIVIATGAEFEECMAAPASRKYIGTFQNHQGRFVGHVFEQL